MKIPRTMSTQHPDNVRQPFFVQNQVIAGDDEIKEAYYAFSHLHAREQLWDVEGKEADSHVVEKLLSKYGDFFHQNRLGKDVFLTFRGPNPRVEKNQGKVLLEMLESIPRNFDVATKFYGEDSAPIFEVAIPMTTSAREITLAREYYRKVVIGKRDKVLEGTKISDWVGNFKPDDINIIPLIEDKESMLNCDSIIRGCIKGSGQETHRVWLARSDPALNYGSAAAVLINKIALQKLESVQEELSVDIGPIIGCGSVPFRGNFRPDNLENCMGAYPSVQTFTLQSAFKYDFPERQVVDAVEELEGSKPGKARHIDEAKAMHLVEKLAAGYQEHVRQAAPLVYQMSSLMPPRRKRKLHIGLFGYSRESSGVNLPRAITFCAALYSLGLPPELFGLSALNEKEKDTLHDLNSSFEQDMKDALKYFNPNNLGLLPKELATDMIEAAGYFDFESDQEHNKITSAIAENLSKGKREQMTEGIEHAALLRGYMG